MRTALRHDADVYAVHEGLQGLVDGDELIQRCDWNSVGSIMHLAGTVIGTARSTDFRERPGRLRAARNLVDRGIDRLVVVGGDGSLTGTDTFRAEWSGLVEELLAAGQITAEQAERHAELFIAGVVGSIDNDMVGTDMTVGADTALHRIIEAIDSLSATAASHRRSYVVEVMGRRCGYLAMMSAIAGAADYVIIPENPPGEGWQEELIDRLLAGRAAGRRDSHVVIAEGAIDRAGNPIISQAVAALMSEHLGEDTRVTILGHVQRGGSPTAYDRWMPSLMGNAAALDVLMAEPGHIAQLIGVKDNRVTKSPLMEAVARTRAIPEIIESGDYPAAMAARGSSFTEMARVFAALAKPQPLHDGLGTRLAVMHAGGLAPGMNAAVASAVRFGISRGHQMLGVRNGFPGLIAGNLEPLSWGDVEGWVGVGGARLGTSRHVPTPEEFSSVSRTLENSQIDGLLIVGGHMAYQAAWRMEAEKGRHLGLQIPVLCLPASIDNNLPGVDMSMGADTALNSVVQAVDRIKQAAMASRRMFVVETMGRWCGFLALMGGLCSGAERVYLHEEGLTLAQLNADVEEAMDGFRRGRSFHLAVRNERASLGYTTDFLRQLFAEESRGLFDVRTLVLGHLQQGGDPTPFDRVQATRLAAHGIDWLTGQILAGRTDWRYVAMRGGKIDTAPVAELPDVADLEYQRPRDLWWMDLRRLMDDLANPPMPSTHGVEPETGPATSGRWGV